MTLYNALVLSVMGGRCFLFIKNEEALIDMVKKSRAKGSIKIELMDADTGNVVQTVKKNNFISKGMDTLYLIQMKNLFQRNKATGGYNLEQIGDPFRRMYLTDADHDEDPENEWLMRGNVIGTAFTNNASMENNGDLGGQYNDAESFTSDDMVRIVIDFPATSANGTINSVYFHAGGNVMASRVDYDGIKILNNGQLRKIVHYGDRVYAILRTGSGYLRDKLVVMDKNYNELGYYDINSANDYYPAGWMQGVSSMSFYNGRLYFVGMDGNAWHQAEVEVKHNGVVWSISVDELDDNFKDPDSTERGPYLEAKPSFRRDLRFGAISTSSNNRYNDYQTLVGIEYDPETSRFIIADGVLNELVITDNEFNILEILPLTTSFGDAGRNQGFLINHDGDYIMGSYTLDIKTGHMIDRGHNVVIKGFTPDGLPIVGNYITPKIGFSSRARINTVTKTSSNIMKVTYDFVLPSTLPSQDDF